MKRFFTTSLMLLALSAFLRAGEPNAAQFKALSGVAQDMDHTMIGMAYEEHFADLIRADMGDALKSCAAHAKPPFEVDLVFVLSAQGKVEHIFADPSQPISACVAAKLSREQLPPPPRAEWMQLVNIYIKQ